VNPPSRPSRPGGSHLGWYEPDAPTIEMPIIDSPAFTDPVLREPPRPPRPPLAPRPRPEVEAKPAEIPSSQKASALVAAGILLSRLAGLVREVVISAYLGTSGAADAFKAALRIPNLLQNLLGEGVLSASFIPVYARLHSEGEEQEAGRLAGAIAGLMIALTGVLSFLGLVLAEPITRLVAAGFGGDDRFDLTVQLVRIMFPGVGFLVLSAWCLGVLNSHRRFFLSYVAPVLWNAAQIVAVVTVATTTTETLDDRAVALAWGVLIGGILQLGVQLPSVIHLLGQVRLSLDTRRASVRNVLSRFGPVVMARGVVQILGYVDLVLASFLAVGAVSSLTYAQVLYLLPISLFGMSVAAAELPDLSQVEVYDPATRQLYRRRLEEGMARIGFYVMPTAALFITVGDVIVQATFQRGNFGADDTWAVWLTLAAFSTGLPASTGSRLLQNGLYALDDAKTPARLAMIRVAIAAMIGMAFMFPLDRLTITADGISGWGDIWALGPLPDAIRKSNELVHLGIVALAIGASVAAWIEYLALSRALAWRIGRTRLAGRWLNPIAASCAGASIVAYGMVNVAGDLPSILSAILVLVPAGLVYLGLTRWLKVPEAISLVERVRSVAYRARGS
jgi:putative peptidoglycan lipid II flippase